MQKRPTNQTKPTNEAPAPTHQHQGPPGSVPEKDGGQRQRGGLANPTYKPNRLSFGGKLDLILLKAVDDVSMFILAGTDLKELYKGPHTTLTTHTT